MVPRQTEPQWPTVVTCFAKHPIGTFFLTSLPQHPGPTSQLNYWCSNPCLRVCFQGTHTKTGANLPDASAPLKSPPEVPPNDLCFYLTHFLQRLRWRLRTVACCSGTLPPRIKPGLCWEGGEEDGCWGGAPPPRAVAKASVSLTFLSTCPHNPKHSCQRVAEASPGRKMIWAAFSSLETLRHREKSRGMSSLLSIRPMVCSVCT